MLLFSLVILIAAEAVLLLFMMRQIGLIVQRIPEGSIDSAVENLTSLGAHFDATELLASIPSQGWNFIFVSFTCPLCQPIIHALHTVPAEIKQRSTLLMLEPDLDGTHVQHQLHELKIEDYSTIDGYKYIKQFGVRRTPYLVCLDAVSRISKREFVRSVDQLV